MSIYTISDLHLPFGADKPMNIFKGWNNYTERIVTNWTRLVKPEDTVVLPGDLSWALKLEDSLKDFQFLENLPGKKVILKGNHDLWWNTLTKLKAFLETNKIHSVTPVFNNCVIIEGQAVCGSRGWFFDDASSDTKVVLREAGRLRLSLSEAVKTGCPPLVFLHYPPAYFDSACEEIISVLKEFNINQVYYGHIHGSGLHRAVKEYDGIKLKLVSCDCIDFTPFHIL